MFGIRDFFKKLFNPLFKKKDNVRLGIYGPPNGGKTTLANRICLDWLGEELGTVSNIPHETREIRIKEKVTIEEDGKKLSFNLVDTPGIATKIDFEDFIEEGMEEEKAKSRAKEATKGIIDSIKWLDNVDAVVLVMDATRDPFNQVNVTIVGNLSARDIPVVIAANKVDLKKADPERVKSAFPQYEVMPISAKDGDGMDDFYKKLIDLI